MKYMNMKRFGALALAVVLAMSLAVPVFADDPFSSTISGAYEPIDLAVTVSNTGTAMINPYGLPVDLKVGAEGSETVAATIVGEKITTGAALTIENGSKVALAVSADVIGTEGGDVKLVESLPTSGENVGLKNVAAKFEAFAAPGIKDGSTDAEKAVAFAALKSEDAALTAPVLVADENGKGQTTTGELILRKGDADGKTLDGGAAFFRLSGDVTKKPTADWAETDTFTAVIAFSFEPSEYVGTVQLTAPASVANGSTGTVTVTMPSGVKAVYDTIKWTSSDTIVTVADATTAPESGTVVSAVSATLTGTRTSSNVATITLEFEGEDGITYRGTVQVRCG